MGSYPPGWYQDPDGSSRHRWWDGEQWTGHLSPPGPAAAPSASNSRSPARGSKPRPSTGRQILVGTVGGTLVFLIGLGAVALAKAPRSESVSAQGATTTSIAVAAADDQTDTEADREAADRAVETTTSVTVPASPVTAAEVSTTIEPATTTTTRPPTTAKPTTTAKATTIKPTTSRKPTTTVSAAASTNSCHPAYYGCIPNHPGNALNCPDIASSKKPVTLRDVTVDPYGLDADSDGIGCESG